MEGKGKGEAEGGRSRRAAPSAVAGAAWHGESRQKKAELRGFNSKGELRAPRGRHRPGAGAAAAGRRRGGAGGAGRWTPARSGERARSGLERPGPASEMRGIPGWRRLRLAGWRRCTLAFLLAWAAGWVVLSALLLLLHGSAFSERCTDEDGHRILARLVRAPRRGLRRRPLRTGGSRSTESGCAAGAARERAARPGVLRSGRCS